ncbi:uncharacterized protein B0P05DRAFT_471179 [Gilbertella persicaria]|uniref:N-acetyltransferase domain-containing protein n=1 Tax=Rhizopus stolonifer TaxID=4846 RepID=A0A367KHU5_RHIST|nr:uncharacterized protein B0P05DRAFT_471179 [Gilbertella persicaria]KAI8078042.1 hypothetical protein B0P05DRAFT_471179 [Gilbertella persicaria]RCI01711.1 hypothetical protein CU098_007995 [Rhizopus stolonifer]
MAQQAEEKKHSATSYYCGTIWNNKDLLFAIFAENEGFLYASCLFDETRPDAIAILFNDVISSSLDDIQGLHAYQPVLSTLGHLCQSQTGHELQRKNPVWSHQLTQVDWTPRALSISQQQESMLRIATKDDLDLLRPWTIAFIKDVFGDTNVILESVESICRDMIESRSVYMLCINGVPVTMARKVRPLKYGCSLAYVYTPEEHRHKGYGEACVSMVSNLLLKEFQYVTLFVDIEIDPHNNLYTRVGYEHYGEAGRFVLLK